MVTALLALAASAVARADPLHDFSDQFWQWRAAEQPFGTDDIPRIERPTGFVVDWSAATIDRRLRDLEAFERRWQALLPPATAAVQDQVDYRLLGSAIARVRWELAVLERWKRDPNFYIEETLGAVFSEMLPPPPFAPARQREIVSRMQRIPATLGQARQNLSDMRQAFVELAVLALDGIAGRVRHSAAALEPEFTATNGAALEAAMPAAVTALEEYRAWLRARMPDARRETAIGRAAYVYFLRNVALMPFTPEQLLTLSRQEWSRSVAFESYQRERLAGSAPAPIFASADAQIAAEKIDEQKIRDFLVEKRILTVPAWLKHYRNLLLPAYLEPLQDLGETDDLTGPSRLGEDGTRYIRAPRPDLGFFYLSTARDPRPIIVHEGVPGHYLQLCLGWHNPDSIRRHYYDSGANEGIGFYAEEMMLQAGLFDDDPHTRETIYSFMRLRALRVEVDVKLALGEFTLAQAADYLERTVPMDKATASSEAALFAGTPGQGISYQIGKVQINELLADVRRAQGAGFSLRAFNDSVWNNGNVPLALQRWELTHDDSAVPGAQTAPPPMAAEPAPAKPQAVTPTRREPEDRLSIDRLYRLPWVTGSAPKSPAWSPDSRRLAFLWNDAGTNFYDVWLTDVKTAQAVRVTSMPRPASPTAPGKDVAQLEQVAKAETDRGVSAVFWAPDGRHVIFNFHGRLFQVQPAQPSASRSARATAASEPQPLASCETGIEDAAPAPRKGAIAYRCGGDLMVMRPEAEAPAATSASTRAAAIKAYSPGRKGRYVESFLWSSDGERLAFVEADDSDVPVRGIPDYLTAETRLVPVKRPFPGEPAESRRVGIVAASGGDVQWLDLGGEPSDQIFSVAWSPDGRTLLVDESDLYIKDRRLMLADASSGRARVLRREVDPHNVTAEWWSDWAPDGRGVYYISDRDNDYHVYYQALVGGEPKRITSGDWAVFSASICPAANALFIVTNEGRPEERQVSRVPLAGDPAARGAGHASAPGAKAERGATASIDLARITAAAGAHHPVPSPDGKFIADLFSNDVTPPDLYLRDAIPRHGLAKPPPGSIEARQVTHSPLPEFARYRWVAAKYVTFPNVNDGTTLHARLTLPPDFDPVKKYPAILGSVYSNTVHNEWGGRIYHPTWGLDQFLAQQGYVIMNVDISGSSGYGKLFRQRIREDYGGVDVEDLYSGVQYLVGQGFVDAHRVGIWGSSYGGLLTATSLFTKPGVYRAGVAGAPATSLFHAQTGEMRTMMAPQDHEEQYAKSSAYLKSGGLKDHLLIIHGMRDDTVLFKDSVTLQQRLILQGNDVDFVMLPNAPHGWDTEDLAQTRFAYRKLFDYFEKYLGADAADGDR
jgi:dipeptidyl-peptidase-4